MEACLPAEIAWRKNKIAYEPPQKLWLQEDSVQEMIMESRKELVKQGILSKKVLRQAIEPKAAHEPGNFDWRYLSAASLFK